jgi:tryptophan synthase alpha chain
MGVTGARTAVSTNLAAFVERVRAAGDGKLAVGFGISNPDQAAEVGKLADGVIVGSALIKVVDAAEDKPAAAGAFVAQFC